MGWEFMNIIAQPGEINDRQSNIIEFVENAGVNIVVFHKARRQPKHNPRSFVIFFFFLYDMERICNYL